MVENPYFLKEQIITYLGNKRSLLPFIKKGILYAISELKRDKLDCVDLFSGSGIVSRFLKQYSKSLIANDLERYCKIINDCYLFNPSRDFLNELKFRYLNLIREIPIQQKGGLIRELYSPKNDKIICADDRAFYTNYNASYIDTARILIEKECEFKHHFLAPLLYISSVHTNTSGVFKGFYKNKNGIGEFGGEGKNALSRITSKMVLPLPLYSRFSVEFFSLQMDANILANDIKCDLCYIDPPYNQHPYGSNYFMLNVISDYKRPENISKISGITKDWNRSVYNNKKYALQNLLDMVDKLKSKFILISYNNEGIIDINDFKSGLSKIGSLNIIEQTYNTFKASRNLQNRKIHVKELLFILKK